MITNSFDGRDWYVRFYLNKVITSHNYPSIKMRKVNFNQEEINLLTIIKDKKKGDNKMDKKQTKEAFMSQSSIVNELDNGRIYLNLDFREGKVR